MTRRLPIALVAAALLSGGATSAGAAVPPPDRATSPTVYTDLRTPDARDGSPATAPVAVSAPVPSVPVTDGRGLDVVSTLLGAAAAAMLGGLALTGMRRRRVPVAG